MTTPESEASQPEPNRTAPKAALVVALLFLGAFIYNIAGSYRDDDTDEPSGSSVVATSSSVPVGVNLDPDRCGTNQDVLVWNLVPDGSPTADRLGSFDRRTCQSTFDYLQTISDTGEGFCTEAAWASDNPGYDESVRPAPPLKNVKVSIGPACR